MQLAEAESRRAQLEKSLKSSKAELDAKDEELNQERRAKAVLEATKKKVLVASPLPSCVRFSSYVTCMGLAAGKGR
jgi:chromosome segregation ATPase